VFRHTHPLQEGEAISEAYAAVVVGWFGSEGEGLGWDGMG
jgi:hypothetical protein